MLGSLELEGTAFRNDIRTETSCCSAGPVELHGVPVGLSSWQRTGRQ